MTALLSAVPARAVITVSIVSHGHGSLLRDLLSDLARLASPWLLEVVVTLNVPEAPDWVVPDMPYPVRWIYNQAPRGFGANHNAAARQARGDVLAILNPDLRLDGDPFGALWQALQCPQMGMVAPSVSDAHGGRAPAARPLYTPLEIASRLWRRAPAATAPDWLAGMFLLVRRAVFEQLGGFDERYFLYIEDVDFSTRLQLAGWRLACVDAVRVRHAAQYASHRSWRHLRWHVAGMLRYWTSPGFWRLWWARRVG